MARTQRVGLGWIGYLAAFVFLTFPLVRQPGTHVPARFSPDLEHSLWVQWWFATATGSGEHALFRSRMIGFPHGVDLQLADLNLAVNAAFFAVGRVLDTAATWNLLLLLSFGLSAGLVWRLAVRLGTSPAAGWTAGLLYAASPYWTASALNGWCYLVHTWTLPLVLLAALGVRDRPGVRSGVWLGASLALAFHVTPYYFLYAVVLLSILALLWWPELRRDVQRHDAWKALAVASAAMLLLVAPRAVSMLAAASRELVVHHGPLNTQLALPVLELVWPSQAAVASRLPRLGYLVGFVGWSSLLVLLLAAARGRRGSASHAWRWLGAGGLLLLLALGPRIAWTHDQVTSIPLPGAWLQRLPLFDLTTNHWRWILPAGLCLSLALAGAIDLLARSLPRRLVATGRAPGLLAAVLVLVWALEVARVWPLPYPRPLWEVRASPVADLLRDRGDVRAVHDRTARRKLNQTVHGKPIALGWLPRIDRETQRANEALVADCGRQGPPCLARHGIDAVIRDDHTALLLGEDGAVREVLVADGGAPFPSAQEAQEAQERWGDGRVEVRVDGR